MRPALDAVVIGGGVVGAALIRALSRFPGRWLLLEKEVGLARHASGRNSGVIHSGIYTKPGTLKATLAKVGVPALYRYCAERGVPHRRIGKLIVATTPEEVPRIERLAEQGRGMGIPDIALCTPREAEAHEPAVACETALWVPGAGIINSRLLTESLVRDAWDSGAEVWTGAGVGGLRREEAGIILSTAKGEVRTRYVINCAGTHTDTIAHALGAAEAYVIVPFRGDYRALTPAKRPLVCGLIYPAKDPLRPFLGVHLTRTITGDVLVGPNATIAPGRERYRGILPRPETIGMALEGGFWRMMLFNKGIRQSAFEEVTLSLSPRAMAEAVARMVPGIRKKDLVSAGRSGIRAQLVERKTGALVEDILIEEQEDALHVLNAVSPAMTNCLSFADHLVDRLRGPLDLGGSGGAKA